MDIREIRRKNLDKLIQEEGSIKAVADKLEMNPSQISQIRTKYRNMGHALARRIETKFGLSAGKMDNPNEVEGLREEKSTYQTNVETAYVQQSTRTAPIISSVAAGEPIEAIDLFNPGDGEDYEDVPLNAGPRCFWLRVIGDSMKAPTGPSIPEGHLILVDPDAQANNGSLVVAKLEDSQDVTFKKLVYVDGYKYLKPLNPDYKTIPINGNCRIVGVVREARLKL